MRCAMHVWGWVTETRTRISCTYRLVVANFSRSLFLETPDQTPPARLSSPSS